MRQPKKINGDINRDAIDAIGLSIDYDGSTGPDHNCHDREPPAETLLSFMHELLLDYPNAELRLYNGSLRNFCFLNLLGQAQNQNGCCLQHLVTLIATFQNKYPDHADRVKLIKLMAEDIEHNVEEGFHFDRALTMTHNEKKAFLQLNTPIPQWFDNEKNAIHYFQMHHLRNNSKQPLYLFLDDQYEVLRSSYTVFSQIHPDWVPSDTAFQLLSFVNRQFCFESLFPLIHSQSTIVDVHYGKTVKYLQAPVVAELLRHQKKAMLDNCKVFPSALFSTTTLSQEALIDLINNSRDRNFYFLALFTSWTSLHGSANNILTFFISKKQYYFLELFTKNRLIQHPEFHAIFKKIILYAFDCKDTTAIRILIYCLPILKKNFFYELLTIFENVREKKLILTKLFLQKILLESENFFSKKSVFLEQLLQFCQQISVIEGDVLTPMMVDTLFFILSNRKLDLSQNSEDFFFDNLLFNMFLLLPDIITNETLYLSNNQKEKIKHFQKQYMHYLLIMDGKNELSSEQTHEKKVLLHLVKKLLLIDFNDLYNYLKKTPSTPLNKTRYLELIDLHFQQDILQNEPRCIKAHRALRLIALLSDDATFLPALHYFENAATIGTQTETNKQILISIDEQKMASYFSFFSHRHTYTDLIRKLTTPDIAKPNYKESMCILQ